MLPRCIRRMPSLFMCRPGCLPVVCLTLLAVSASSQVLVPFDPDSTVFIVTSQFERETSYLNVPNLEDARIIRETDDQLVLFLTFMDSAGYRIERRRLAPTDLSFYRDRYVLVTRGRRALVSTAEQQEGDGSSMFVQTMAGLGLSWYGLTLPAGLSVEGSATIGLYLLTGASCYFIADGYASSHRITAGEGAAFQYFATRGILHGYALLGAIQGTDVDHRLGVPIATLASLGEGFAMMNLAGRRHWPESYVSTLGTYGDAGLLLGISAGYLTGEGSTSLPTDLGDHVGRYAGSILATSALGFLIGSYAGDAIHYAPGDASVQESIGYLGAATGYAVADAPEGAGNASRMVGVTLGFLGGHVLGAVMASNKDLTQGEANRVRLLTSGGIVFGLGVAYMITGGDMRAAGFVGSGVAGGTLGLLFGLSRTGKDAPPPGGDHTSLQFRPEGLFVPYTIDRSRGTVRTNPVLTMQVRF